MPLTIPSLRSKTTPIGVDLGDCAVRMVQARREGDVYVMGVATQSERTSPSEPSDAKDAFRSITEARLKASFVGRSAVAALSTPDLAFHALDLPRAALQSGHEDLVRVEVERLTSHAANEFETRHWVIPPTATSGPSALAVESGHEPVTAAIDACSAGKLDCICVEPAPAALVRFASLARPSDPKTIRGVLDLGGRQSRLIIFEDETPLLVRTTGTGGRSWTQRIADSLQITFKAAEVHKRSHGICRTGPSRGADDARSELPAMLLGAIRLDLTEIASEVKRSFEYVLGCHPSCRAGDLMLVGGGARLRNISEFLNAALGIEIAPASDYVARPESRIHWPSSHRDPIDAFALAAGLALGEDA